MDGTLPFFLNDRPRSLNFKSKSSNMKAENHSLNAGKTLISLPGIVNTIQEFFKERTQGLNFFEKLLMTIYSFITMMFLLSALYLVFTEGFKF